MPRRRSRHRAVDEIEALQHVDARRRAIDLDVELETQPARGGFLSRLRGAQSFSYTRKRDAQLGRIDGGGFVGRMFRVLLLLRQSRSGQSEDHRYDGEGPHTAL